MSLPDNIEKSFFRQGQYVGYGGGHVWEIKKERNNWYARATIYSITRKARTLKALSVLIKEYKP